MQSVQLISDIPAAIIQLQQLAHATQLSHRTDHRQVGEPKSLYLSLKLCDARILLRELRYKRIARALWCSGVPFSVLSLLFLELLK